jgi:hypothetical protein
MQQQQHGNLNVKCICNQSWAMYVCMYVYMCYVSMSVALTRLWRHSETALCRNHGNRSFSCTQTSEHKCAAAAVEGRRCVSYLNRRTEGITINCQSGLAACGLRIELRTFKTAFVLILVTDCLHFQRRAPMSPSVCRFSSSYFSSSFRTPPCSQQTRTDVAACWLIVRSIV